MNKLGNNHIDYMPYTYHAYPLLMCRYVNDLDICGCVCAWLIDEFK